MLTINFCGIFPIAGFFAPFIRRIHAGGHQRHRETCQSHRKLYQVTAAPACGSGGCSGGGCGSRSMAAFGLRGRRRSWLGSRCCLTSSSNTRNCAQQQLLMMQLQLTLETVHGRYCVHTCRVELLAYATRWPRRHVGVEDNAAGDHRMICRIESRHAATR